MTRVKICCIQSVAEANLAIEAGADAIGLVSAMPSGPGPIAEELIAEITAAVPRGTATFLLTCLTDPGAIAGQHHRCRTTTIQLCDALEPGAYAELRAALPNVALVQVIHVRDEHSLEEAMIVAPRVDALLLDSGNPSLAVKELGGTGRMHDWLVSRQIVENVELPVWLAGGLNPSNVRQAIDAVSPYGVDVCSGLRPDGAALDRGRLREFVSAVAGSRG